MDTNLINVSFRGTDSQPTSSNDRASASHKQPRAVAPGRADGKQELVSRADGLLSREEELSLFIRWRESGDDRALHALVLAYEPLVTGIVSRLRRSDVSLQDAKQEARCGLLEAARRYDPSKGFRFGTYARWWMLAAVNTYLVADRDILSSRRMKRKPKLLPSNFVSLDAPVTPDGGSVAEVIPSDGPGLEFIVEQAIDGERMQLHLANALNALEPRERLVVRRRHLSDKCDTLQSVAEDMQLTAERVRQIEKTALARLRNMMEACLSRRAGGVISARPNAMLASWPSMCLRSSI